MQNTIHYNPFDGYHCYYMDPKGNKFIEYITSAAALELEGKGWRVVL